MRAVSRFCLLLSLAVVSCVPGFAQSPTPPAVSLTSPADGTTFNAPASISLAATASPIIDATSSSQVTESGLTYNKVRRIFTGTITVANTSSQAIAGPVQLILTQFPSGLVLMNATSTYQGSPYLTASTGALAPGAAVTSQVQFYRSDPNANVSYIPLVYSGDPGASISSVQFFANGVSVGQATASPFTYAWSNVSGGNYTLTATATDSDGNSATSAPVTVSVVALQGVSLAPASVTGGSPSTGTVTLTGPAPSGGLSVSLSSDNAAATVPASVSIPAGANRTTFTVSTSAVHMSVTANISASCDGVTQSAALTINLPAFGYVPQPRTGTDPNTDGNDLSDYDWTGLTQQEVLGYDDVDQSTAYLPNQSQTQPGLSLGWYSYPLDGYPFASYTATGTSTYKWLWTPPTDDHGIKNDPTKAASDPSQPFPAYPVYMLSKVDPYLQEDADVGASGTFEGGIKDGFDPSWNPMFQSLNNGTAALPPNSLDSSYNYIGQLPRRFIQAGATDSTSQSNPAKQIADATLSPFIYGYIQTNDFNADLYASLDGFVSPIQMTYPSVFGRPDLGDGNNQFVYTADVPNSNNPYGGILSIPAEIQAPGATTDDLQWLLTPTKGGPNPQPYDVLAKWDFDQDQNNPVAYPLDQYLSNKPISTAVVSPYVDSNGDTGIVPNGVAQTNDPASTAALGNAAINVFGLPAPVSAFGNHTATLEVGTYASGKPITYNASAEAHFQTFFTDTASNWPGSNGPYNPNNTNQPWSGPNWLYYYNQVFPAFGPTDPDTGQSQYTGSYVPQARTKAEYPTGVITLSDDAYGKERTMPVFDIGPSPDYLVRYIGKLYVPGIFYYIYAAAHEQGHVNTYKMPVTISDPDNNNVSITNTIWTSGKATSPNNVFDPNAPIMSAAPPGADRFLWASNDTLGIGGSDQIWDGWEYYHHMDPRTNDTTGAYKDIPLVESGDIPDNEVLADIQAFGVVMSYLGQSAWKSDWSNNGVNYGVPYFVSDYQPGQQPAGVKFHLKFMPAVAGATFKPGEGPLEDGFYPITSLSDLHNEYPSVLTALP